MKSANLHLAEIILLTIENKPVIHNHFSRKSTRNMKIWRIGDVSTENGRCLSFLGNLS